MGQILAALEAPDLLRDQRTDGIGVAHRRVVRRDGYFGMCPEGGSRIGRLGLEDIERRVAKGAVIQAGEDVSLDLRGAPACIDELGRAEPPASCQPREQGAGQEACLLYTSPSPRDRG